MKKHCAQCGKSWHGRRDTCPRCGSAQVYEAGGGIIISGKTIAVKVGAGDKYLINKSGALYSQGIDEAIEAAITEALSWHEA